MAIETSFTIKQLNADEALKQAEEKAKKTAQNIDNTLNKNPVEVQVKPFGKTVAGELKKIKAGLSAVGAEGAGEMGKLAKVFSAGPIAFAVAAIGGGLAYLANGIKDTYDKMTLSSEEYAYRQAQITKDSHDATEKIS